MFCPKDDLSNSQLIPLLVQSSWMNFDNCLIVNMMKQIMSICKGNAKCMSELVSTPRGIELFLNGTTWKDLVVGEKEVQIQPFAYEIADFCADLVALYFSEQSPSRIDEFYNFGGFTALYGLMNVAYHRIMERKPRGIKVMSICEKALYDSLTHSSPELRGKIASNLMSIYPLFYTYTQKYMFPIFFLLSDLLDSSQKEYKTLIGTLPYISSIVNVFAEDFKKHRNLLPQFFELSEVKDYSTDKITVESYESLFRNFLAETGRRDTLNCITSLVNLFYNSNKAYPDVVTIRSKSLADTFICVLEYLQDQSNTNSSVLQILRMILGMISNDPTVYKYFQEANIIERFLTIFAKEKERKLSSESLNFMTNKTSWAYINEFTSAICTSAYVFEKEAVRYHIKFIVYFMFFIDVLCPSSYSPEFSNCILLPLSKHIDQHVDVIQEMFKDEELTTFFLTSLYSSPQLPPNLRYDGAVLVCKLMKTSEVICKAIIKRPLLSEVINLLIDGVLENAFEWPKKLNLVADIIDLRMDPECENPITIEDVERVYSFYRRKVSEMKISKEDFIGPILDVFLRINRHFSKVVKKANKPEVMLIPAFMLEYYLFFFCDEFPSADTESITLTLKNLIPFMDFPGVSNMFYNTNLIYGLRLLWGKYSSFPKMRYYICILLMKLTEQKFEIPVEVNVADFFHKQAIIYGKDKVVRDTSMCLRREADPSLLAATKAGKCTATVCPRTESLSKPLIKYENKVYRDDTTMYDEECCVPQPCYFCLTCYEESGGSLSDRICASCFFSSHQGHKGFPMFISTCCSCHDPNCPCH